MAMDRRTLYETACDFVDVTALNRVPEAVAIRPELAGMRMYEHPLLGVAPAGDPFFAELRRPGVIGPHFRLPGEWLPGAASVVSLFLPFTDPVIESNRRDPEWPSPEWLHARIEGQQMINQLCIRLVELLEQAGHTAVAPSLHKDFWSWAKPAGTRDDGREVPGFTSNWSERHVADVAGLGTFGLSAGLITARGMAGRIGSVVTTLELAPDTRPYQRFDEYCTHCGACVGRCRDGAIAMETRKNKEICSGTQNRMKVQFAPRYGCGKCQVAVPCERRIPSR